MPVVSLNMMKRWILLFWFISVLSACVRVGTETTPVPATESTSQAWWRNAVFYEIFVRSFYDTDGDGIGDFNGITQKLDYLKQLGINAIWLMPIHPSPSYHGYDVTDNYAVNPQYGTLEVFKHFLAEAHKSGIHVIMDLVLNHTSNRHPFFVDALKGPTSKYYDWYIWSNTQKGSNWHQVTGATPKFYFGLFCDCMPDLNYNNPEVTAEMLKVTNFWLNDIGIDGFRVDAAKHLIEEGDKVENTPATHEWLKGFYTAYKRQNPQAYTVGEVYGAGSSIVKSYTGNQLDQVFNFEMASGFIGGASGGSNSGINSALKFSLQDMPDFNFATFLTNHDQNRVISVFNGELGKAKVAATMLLTSPGTPFIYYGEEIGMSGVKPDEDIRSPMQWSNQANAGFTVGRPWRMPNKDYTFVNVSAQQSDPESLFNHYRALIALRHEHPALRSEKINLLSTNNPGVYAVLRTSENEIILVIVNLTGETVSDYALTLEEGVLTKSSYRAESLFGGGQAEGLNGNGGFSSYKPFEMLSPYGSYIIQLIP